MWDILNSKTHTDQQPEVPRNVEYGSLLRSDSSEMEVNKSLLEGLWSTAALLPSSINSCGIKDWNHYGKLLPYQADSD